MDDEFSCVTYNVKCLRDKCKRNKHFSYLKDKVKNGFVMLQETHSIENDFSSWKHEWQGEIVLNNGSSNSRGTMIAFTKNFIFNMKNMPLMPAAEFKFAQSHIIILSFF